MQAHLYIWLYYNIIIRRKRRERLLPQGEETLARLVLSLRSIRDRLDLRLGLGLSLGQGRHVLALDLFLIRTTAGRFDPSGEKLAHRDEHQHDDDDPEPPPLPQVLAGGLGLPGLG